MATPFAAPRTALTPRDLAGTSVTDLSSRIGTGERHRILHVFRAPVGGLFRHVVDLTRLQAEAGHAVGLVCDASTGGERAERALADLGPHLALGVTRIPMRRNPHASDLGALRAVRERALAEQVDVLHGHGAKGGVFARLAPLGRAGRTVIRAYTPHGGSYNYRPGTPLHRLYMAAEQMMARTTDLFLFESEYVASRHAAFAGGAPRLQRIVHNGLAEAEFAPVETAADPFDLVYVGELREAKGLPVLLRALAKVRAQGREMRLLMVGSGPDTESLAAMAENLGLRHAIAFEPPQAIRPVLGRGRVMVVPSLAESLPYVVLEAAAAAQPLVATNVGGIPEIFGSLSGDLVPPGDCEALSVAIMRILDEEPAIREGRARALSEALRMRFSMNRMATDVLCGYAAAFRAKRVRAAQAPVTA
ncbi:glycosyltransferase family 4 protein [Methylorubrum populi]|uniref:glycosyltransferase family 4 protein n=1 Tax=Methylorubrum populi TaxID=223967 RepID=UPI00015D3475|nr:glycosyltransferase family 4 protein [Methylorubrum populi]OAH33213.1 glycosyl transferase family 1 [Methylorubrum populi]PZP71988.1 MAG: glycosyltransferase family 1 protein [Methylorubrum populi]